MEQTNPQTLIKLLRAAGFGGALLGACVLGPLIDLIPNHGLRGFTFVEMGLGGVIILGIVARRSAAMVRTRTTGDEPDPEGGR
jgi:hypothetical protein